MCCKFSPFFTTMILIINECLMSWLHTGGYNKFLLMTTYFIYLLKCTDLQTSMQCWCSLLLHPSLQLIKLSPSTISSRHIGHTSSSSRAFGSDIPKLDEFGDGEGGFSWSFEREIFESVMSLDRRDLSRAWNLDNNFST